MAAPAPRRPRGPIARGLGGAPGRRRRAGDRLPGCGLLRPPASRAPAHGAATQPRARPAHSFNWTLGGMMSRPTPDTLSRLRAANPAPVDHELGRGVTAQATLERIISEQPSSAQPTARRVRLRLPRNGLGVTLAVLCLGGGAALAATNPFGWWSGNPSAARYGVDTHVHVRTPTQQQVSCHAAGSGFVCSPRGSGQQYRFVDRVRFPGRLNMITRAGFVSEIALGQTTH